MVGKIFHMLNLKIHLRIHTINRPAAASTAVHMCKRCHMQVVDGGRHLVFECPDLERFRAARKHLFNMSVGEYVLEQRL